jgi:hypothetical protein
MSNRDRPAPVFLGGLSYSGKTQLRQLLEIHTDLSLHRRTRLWRYHGRFGDLDLSPNRRRAREVLESEDAAAVLEPKWDEVFEEFENGEHSYARLFGIVHGRRAAELGKSRWGEQYGGIVRFAPEILAAYPEARIIHMVRHPRERLMRILNRGRRRPGVVGWETAEGIESLRLAEEQSRLYANRYLVLSYERLRQDPMECLGEVCEWIEEVPRPDVGDPGSDGVRFDPDVPAGEEPRALGLAAVVTPGWPTGRAVSRESVSSAGRLSWSGVFRFPVEATTMWYRLNMSNRGKER